jgi:hypothetical protein
MDFSFAQSDRSKRRLEKREEAMHDAKALLTSLGILFGQPDPYQLQFDAYSFWPGTKTLYREGDESSSKIQSLDELTTLIQSLKRLLRPQTDETTTGSPTVVHMR